MAKTEPFDWEEWFWRRRDYVVPTRFYECSREFTVEERYQAFKARLAAEQENENE